MFFDPIYILLMVASAVLGIGAQFMVKGAFQRWSRVGTHARLSGAEVARQILRRAGVDGVRVERVDGFLSDHYDPRTRTLRLSPAVHDQASVASVGVAAHEVGHAIQHARGYFPLKIRSWLAPAASFGSNVGMIVVILGLATGALGMAKVGVVLMAAMVAFVLVTLPVEFDASNRAKRLLPELGLTRGEEGRGVSAVLNAAAMTYVAGAVAAVAQLIYFAWRAGLFGGRSD